jgi:general secretion pathway protein E
VADVVTPLVPQQPLPDVLSAEYLEFNRVLPLAWDEGHVRVAAVGTPAEHVLEDLEQLFGCPVEIESAEEGALLDGIRRATASAETVVELVQGLDDGPAPESATDEGALTDAREVANQPPVVRYVNLLIREASATGASDIHLDATREGLRVRLRVDGVLAEAPAPPKGLQAAVVSRLKLLAELDIAERRLPQDGRIRVRLDAREMDLRLATAPTHFGESVTLRLLERGGRPVSLAELGMAPEVLSQVERLVTRRHGIVLVVGPTGSGKTTTLYAALALRDRTAEKILTVEDPVEYELPGVTQIGVDAQRGLTFARALKTMVRHDPDVLMVGEIRDEESADIAVRAAMTGHLVFSTLHTNDALGAIPRLLDLKVPSYLVAASVEGILAQRLVRRICPECRGRYRPDPQAVALLADQPVGRVTLERGAGCVACRQTGYKSRTGLFELLPFDEDLKEAVSRGADRAALRALPAVQQMGTLKQDGWAKVQVGITTVEEVLRVLQ